MNAIGIDLKKLRLSQVWQLPGKEYQVLLILSALAAGSMSSAPAQTTDIEDGVVQTTTVELNTDGAVLNNNGVVSVAGTGSTTVISSANNTVINNGTATDSGILQGDSRVIDVTGGSGATINNVSGSEIVATGDQRNGTVYFDSDVQDVVVNNAGTINAAGSALGKVAITALQGAGISAELSSTGNDFTITNSGYIGGSGSAAAGSAIAGDGIRLERTRVEGALDGTTTGVFTGIITNEEGGTIISRSTNGTTAGFRAVNGVSFQGTLNNEGTISGAQNGVYFGNAVGAGGADHTGGVVNNSGTISSDSRALNIDGAGLTVNNSGQILGTGNQRNGTLYVDGTADDYTVNNQTGGVIDAGTGNTGSGVAAEIGGAADGTTSLSLTNDGTIAGRGSADAATGSAGDGVRIGNPGNTGIAEGSIVNNGSITSDSNNGTTGGVRIVDNVAYRGTLDNTGTIAGVQNGVYYGNADHTGGVVNNSGIISSDSRTLNIDGTGLTVNNSGQILATGDQRNGTIYFDSTAQGVRLNNEGSISATGAILGASVSMSLQGAGISAELSSTGNDFTITNSGYIGGSGSAAAGSAIAGDGIRLERTRVEGALDGTTTGVFTGTITNEEGGTIISRSTNGTTAGFRAVNGVSFQGTLNNEGTISGAQNGVYFGNAVGAGGADHTGGVVNNSGIISSDSRALNIDGTGLTVNNSGQILGTGNQRNGTLYVDGTADDYTVNNQTGGVIDAGTGNTGSGVAAEIGGAADGTTSLSLTNDGTIAGRGSADAATGSAGDGVRIGNPGNTGIAEGSIVNNGTITSDSNNGTTGGVRIVDNVAYRGTLDNTGTITGVQNGVYYGNADHTGGVVNNSGIISSDSRALNIDGTGLTVNNSGQILGTGDQRNGTIYVDGTFNDVTINNLAGGRVDAGADYNGSGVSIQVDSDNTLRNADITNDGIIQGQGTGSAAGVRVFGGDSSAALANVNITNGAGGSILSSNEVGILIEGVNYSGTITNNGIIAGLTAAIDTSTAGGDVIINQGAGSLLGGVNTGVGNDALNISDFATIRGNIDLGSGNNNINVLTNGTLNADGNLTLTSDLNVDGAVALQAGTSINVDGDASFNNGSEIQLDASSVDVNQSTIDLVNTTGSLTNNGAILIDNSLLLDFSLITEAQLLQAEISEVDLAASVQDSNVASFTTAFQNAVNTGFDDVGFDAIARALDNSASIDAFELEASNLLPSLNIGLARELYNTQSLGFSNVEQRLRSKSKKNAVWYQAFGRSSNRDGSSQITSSGYDATSFGFTLGIDQSYSNGFTGGLAFTYADIDLDDNGVSGDNSDIDYYGIQLYGSYEQNQYFIDGHLAYGFGNIESRRATNFGLITSDSDAEQISAKLLAGYRHKAGKHLFTPFTSLHFAHITQDNFTENGGFGLSVDSDDVNIAEFGIGVEYSTALNFLSVDSNLRFKAGWYYDFAEDERNLDISLNGENFSISGDPASQSSFELEAGIDFKLKDSLLLNLGYQGEFSSGFDSHTGRLGVIWEF